MNNPIVSEAAEELAIETINLIVDLNEVDALDKAIPEVLERFERYIAMHSARTVGEDEVERVARAICAVNCGGAIDDHYVNMTWDAYTDDARAAIAAYLGGE